MCWEGQREAMLRRRPQTGAKACYVDRQQGMQVSSSSSEAELSKVPIVKGKLCAGVRWLPTELVAQLLTLPDISRLLAQSIQMRLCLSTCTRQRGRSLMRHGRVAGPFPVTCIFSIPPCTSCLCKP